MELGQDPPWSGLPFQIWKGGRLHRDRHAGGAAWYAAGHEWATLNAQATLDGRDRNVQIRRHLDRISPLRL